MRSEMQSVTPMLADMQPAPKRSFIKRRTLRGALAWIEKHPNNSPKLRLSDYSKYSKNARDKWFVVNYRKEVIVDDSSNEQS